jgi:hypothetical protein
MKCKIEAQMIIYKEIVIIYVEWLISMLMGHDLQLTVLSMEWKYSLIFSLHYASNFSSNKKFCYVA